MATDFFVITGKVVLFAFIHVFPDINLCGVLNNFYIVVVDSAALAFSDTVALPIFVQTSIARPVFSIIFVPDFYLLPQELLLVFLKK